MWQSDYSIVAHPSFYRDNMLQLLLTRTSEQNSALSAQIKRLDVPVFSATLLQAEALPLSPEMKSTILDLDQFDDIIFISKNAVAFGMPVIEQFWPQWPIRLNWYAVGKATAVELERFDVSPAFPELASSEGLLALPELKQVVGRNVLIVRGVGGRETLKEELTIRGAEVQYLEVYERQEVDQNPATLPDGDCVIALLYSGEAIIRLQELIGERISAYYLIVPSKRLEELAIDRGFVKVQVAKNQEDHAMIEVVNLVLESFS
jgi:uroporphyrinogen-III synthase